MPPCSFDHFFREATGFPPYDYQTRLACGENGENATCESRLISVPTGCGKTAAVVLAWIWNRVYLKRADWPRRLVYCLPMRTLVEQTDGETRKWLKNLGDLEWDGKGDHKDKVGRHLLRGGEEKTDWDLYPEDDAILIGTQDMLLSRALNRGYGMSRYRWPMHFGLLNDDCLWVLDETQLMGVSVETSAQLDGFRSRSDWAPPHASPTWWMSATLDPGRLETIDHPVPACGWATVTLRETERSSGEVLKRWQARKTIKKCGITLASDTQKDYPKQLAALIAAKHKSGTLTLIVVNRVSRARDIYKALRDKKLNLNPSHIALIHSRFRPADRERHTALLFSEGDRIVVATQAVEAGVDVSARLLVTELAPWSSLVQRFGRCNRSGDLLDAEVHWIDVQPKDEKDDLALPYSEKSMKASRDVADNLSDASPHSLASISVPEPDVIRPILRQRDIIDLFDTTPDICGRDLDISRYIRDGNDNDVHLFWRKLGDTDPDEQTLPPEHCELCRVPIGEATKFFKNISQRGWQWNPLKEIWEVAKHPRAGGRYLIDAAKGGYSDGEGWTGDPKSEMSTHLPSEGELDAYRKDQGTFVRTWQTLAIHTEAVVRATSGICQKLNIDADTTEALNLAAVWHDVGKAHQKFQAMLCGENADRKKSIWAKSGNKERKCERVGFRHELASALAWLLSAPSDASHVDLVAYIIAAHHGKVRLSIRALPNEKGPEGGIDTPYARGIWHGDALPSVQIGQVTIPPVTLDLYLMQMGKGEHGRSWLGRMVALRGDLGPFRLAYLETLLRAADARESRV